MRPIENLEKKGSLGFQVMDVKKPLISVKRIVEKGNFVNFGPKLEDNFIQDGKTGDKLMLQPRGKGSFVMEVEFGSGERTHITVDSGAEESACPLHWGREFGLDTRGPRIEFTAANGSRIKHYGSRQVDIVSPF